MSQETADKKSIYLDQKINQVIHSTVLLMRSKRLLHQKPELTFKKVVILVMNLLTYYTELTGSSTLNINKSKCTNYKYQVKIYWSDVKLSFQVSKCMRLQSTTKWLTKEWLGKAKTNMILLRRWGLTHLTHLCTILDFSKVVGQVDCRICF